MDTTTTINPRDVRVTYGDRREGDDYSVTLTHKPTGRSATGKAPTLEGARAIAQRDLEMAVEGRPNPTPGLVH